MKLLINNEYEEVGFWSFAKCNIITQIAIGVIFYSSAFIIVTLLS